MHTTTHVLVSTALFARPGPANRVRNTAAVLGGLTPDLSMVAMVGWAKIVGAPEYRLWTEWYFTPPWQTVIDYFHSIPVYGALAFAGWAVCRILPRLASAGVFLTVFGLGGLTHIALDLPFHNRDAHAHFVPFSNWRFHSPVSYWDPSHYGHVVAPIEMLGGIALCVFLWIRFPRWGVRVMLALAVLSYAGPRLYF